MEAEESTEKSTKELAKLYNDPLAIAPRYPITGRPKTTMKFTTSFCVPGLYLPVVRYENVYYQSKNKPEGKEYCGTFYYYEPYSINSIRLGNTLVTANKLHALVELERKYLSNFRHPIRDLATGNIPTSMSAYLLLLTWDIMFKPITPELGDFTLDTIDIHDINYAWIGSKRRNEYPNYILNIDVPPEEIDHGREVWEEIRSTLMEPSVLEQLDVVYDLMTRVIKNERNIPTIVTNQYAEVNALYDAKSKFARALINKSSHKMRTVLYPGTSLNYIGYRLYSVFDYVDQIICRLAYELGYDTIILQREAGKTRTVTEILDVRPRHLSYGSFCRGLDTRLLIDAADKSVYPTIWFTDYGFNQKD